MRRWFPVLLFIFIASQNVAQIHIVPDRVYDGNEMHEDWTVVVQGDSILAVGPDASRGIKIKETLRLKGQTLMPGMIEGHSHLLLYPYAQTPWNDQVLKESEAERVARATVHAEKTLLAGFTTVRDLGSEGAGYADVGLRDAINKGIIPGPRMLVAGPALVATGSYGPTGFSPDHTIPKGAEESDGADLFRSVRNQIGRGADIIKVYADYRWGPKGEARPTYNMDELEIIVEIAKNSGRPVVAHAYSSAAIRLAVGAGVETIEHAGEGTLEDFTIMKDNNVAVCLTLGATEAIAKYRGWVKGSGEDPPRITNKRKSVQAALESGVTIIAGGDVGVFEHGDNVYELELMVEYGMKTKDVLRAVTSGNANIFHLDDLGEVKPGFLADLVSVEGNPLDNISNLRKVKMVMQAGKIVKGN